MNFELPFIAPSILAADFTKLGKDIGEVVEGGASWIHCDIMDGHFVPNISYGPNIVKAAKSAAPEAFFDVHLMIENPDNFVEAFVQAGADLISVHQETCPHLHRTIEPVLEDVDLVLIMSVNPGFGGQSFIESSYKKLEKLAAIRDEKELGFLIQVDGGVNLKNAKKIANAGADILVAGSSVFSATNISARFEELSEKLD